MSLPNQTANTVWTREKVGREKVGWGAMSIPNQTANTGGRKKKREREVEREKVSS